MCQVIKEKLFFFIVLNPNSVFLFLKYIYFIVIYINLHIYLLHNILTVAWVYLTSLRKNRIVVIGWPRVFL